MTRGDKTRLIVKANRRRCISILEFVFIKVKLLRLFKKDPGLGELRYSYTSVKRVDCIHNHRNQLKFTNHSQKKFYEKRNQKKISIIMPSLGETRSLLGSDPEDNPAIRKKGQILVSVASWKLAAALLLLTFMAGRYS